MKLVIQNPQFLSDTRTTRVHDYIVELLIRFRPAIRIWPLQNLPGWFRFLRLKKLPVTGWTYVFREEDLRPYDVWMNFNDKARLGTRHDPMPSGFSGLKLLHLMDYSQNPQVDEERVRKLGVDYAFGFARHDLRCSFYRKMHPFLQGRVVPVPFGYLPRFRETMPFEQKENRCSVMGTVVPLGKPSSEVPAWNDFLTFFEGKTSAHEMLWRIQNEDKKTPEEFTSFLDNTPCKVADGYDPAVELNRHRFFLSDDSIKHYPPSLTYEGLACGSVMLAARQPVYGDFAFQDGVNCLMYQSGSYEDMMRVLREAIHDPSRSKEIHDRARTFSDRFSHRNVGTSLYRQIELLWLGKIEEALAYWSRPELTKTA